MTIYIDNDFKCYTTAAEGRRAVETSIFDGKCRQFIEGSRFIPEGEKWIQSNGAIVRGPMMTPWRDSAILAELQALYEEEQAKAADMKAALEVLGVSE